MKKALSTIFVALVIGSSIEAAAQEAPPPSSNAPPPAHVGFQIALRTGYAVPMGNARGPNPGVTTQNLAMSDAFSGQVPIFLEIGGKVVPNVFLGGYLGLGFGGPAGQFDTLCQQGNLSCVTVGLRLGAEIQYHILPGESANPWIGYGIGYESIALGMSQGGQTYTDSLSGIEFAHLMGGIDFRVNPIFGIGPFVDFSAGTYSSFHVETTLGNEDGDIPTTTTHEWLAFGVRGTFFP
jgi:hypothetical protein